MSKNPKNPAISTDCESVSFMPSWAKGYGLPIEAIEEIFPDLMLADKIASVISHRIDYPKVKAGIMTRKASLNAKSRPLLTETEKQDVRQTVAFVLTSTGALQRLKLTLGDWKQCFREVRGFDCLGIDRKSKNKSEIVRIDTMTPEEIDVISAKENLPILSDARRKVLARRLRYLRLCVLTYWETTIGRQKAHNRRKLIRVLRFLASHFKTHGCGEGLSEIVETSKDLPKRVSDCIATFQKQSELGEAILTAQAMDGIPSHKTRTFKTFADLA